MIRETNLSVWREAAKEVVVEVKGLDDYKDAWLTICNNVRVDRRLITVENDSKNNIYVTCVSGEEEATMEWLSQFGEIKSCRDVIVYNVEEPDYDMDRFDDAKIVWG